MRLKDGRVYTIDDIKDLLIYKGKGRVGNCTSTVLVRY